MVVDHSVSHNCHPSGNIILNLNTQTPLHFVTNTFTYRGKVQSWTEERTQSWTRLLTLWLYCITDAISIDWASNLPSTGICNKTYDNEELCSSS